MKANNHHRWRTIHAKECGAPGLMARGRSMHGISTMLLTALLLGGCAASNSRPEPPGMKSFVEALRHTHSGYVDPIDSRVLLEQASQGLLKVSGFTLSEVGLPPAALSVGDERRTAGPEQIPFTSLNAFTQLYTAIKARNPSLDDMKLFEGAIRGMLTAVDPRSDYIDPQAARELRARGPASAAIGAEIARRDGAVRVVAPIEGTPAARNGLLAGDVITAIDGQPVNDLTLTQVVRLLRGAVGTSVTLSVTDAGGRQREITIPREIIKYTSVTGRLMARGIAYLRLRTLHAGAGRELGAQLDGLGEHTRVRGVILDLRNNPGGAFNEAVAVTDAFLAQGEIVSLDGRTEGSRMRFSATPDRKRPDRESLPVVVLVNGGTASGAEIVAAALQDHRRAVVIGSGTFGLGTVQTLYTLSDGGLLKLTTSRSLRPNGSALDGHGVTPDVCLASGKAADTGAPGRADTCPQSVSDYKPGDGDAVLAHAVRYLHEVKGEGPVGNR